MQVHVHVPDEFWNSLKDKTGANTNRIWQDSFALYIWAVSEAFRGRVILSSHQSGSDMRRISMPCLELASARGAEFREMLR